MLVCRVRGVAGDGVSSVGGVAERWCVECGRVAGSGVSMWEAWLRVGSSLRSSRFGVMRVFSAWPRVLGSSSLAPLSSTGLLAVLVAIGEGSLDATAMVEGRGCGRAEVGSGWISG